MTVDSKSKIAILLCISMVLSGCTVVNDEVTDGVFEILGCTDTAAYNYNQNCNNQTVVATVDDGCCFYPCDPTVQPAPSTFVTTDATGNCGG